MDNILVSNLVQSTIEKQIANDESQEQLDEKEELDFTTLQLYFGEDYVVNDKITIKQPKIEDFIKYGEDNIIATVAPFTTNTTAYRAILWQMGIDWNKLSDMELCSILLKAVNLEYSKLFFGDLDITSFDYYKKETEKTTEYILYSEKENVQITEDDYKKISTYLRHMFFYFPEEEFTRDKKLKQELVNNDILKARKNKKEGKSYDLQSMISFALNHPGFKYKRDELKDVYYYEFMDSIQRLQVYESTRATFSGVYSGMVDAKKIPKEEFNFMRELHTQNRDGV